MATVQLNTLDKIRVNIHPILVDNDTIIGESAGDSVEYITTIMNEGTTTLSKMSVTSAIQGHGFDCDPILVEELKLAPGATVKCKSVSEVRTTIP